MADNKNKHNGIVSGCLWIGILGYLSISISYIVTMYGDYTSSTILGLGLCSMLALADTLGVLMLLRWSKNGFYLLVLSAALSVVVNLSVLRLGLLPSLYFLIVSAIWFIILQLRSGGKSVWSQLKNGWDSKHCRHIYQLFAIVEVILFVLTLLVFGNRAESSEGSPIKKDEQVKTEPQPLPPSPIKSTKDVDSTQESSTKTPTHTKLPPIESEKASQKKFEKPSKESVKENKKAKDDKAKSSSYDLNAAVKYLDTHGVWKESEMSKYDDLKNLNRQLILSLHKGHSLLPHELCGKSKRLQEIERLLREYGHLRIQSKGYDEQSRIRFHGKETSIEVRQLIMDIRVTIDLIREKEKLRRLKEATSDSIKNSAPSFGLG